MCMRADASAWLPKALRVLRVLTAVIDEGAGRGLGNVKIGSAGELADEPLEGSKESRAVARLAQILLRLAPAVRISLLAVLRICTWDVIACYCIVCDR